MSEYLAHAFYRHTVVQCHDSEAVAAEVKGNRLLDTALLRYCFDAVLAVGVTGNWQQFVPFGHAVVFLDDVSGNVQQPDIRFDACFLAVRVDPQMPVERGAQVGFVRFAISVQLKPVKVQKMNKSRISSIAFLLECAID